MSIRTHLIHSSAYHP
jgi:hypothetical protein